MKFNFFTSIPFWVVFCLIVLFTRFFDKKPTIRRLLLLAASIFMVLAIPGFNPINMISLFILTAFSFSIGYFLNGRSLINNHSVRRLVLIIGIAGILCFLAFYKYSFIQNLFLGDSLSDGGSTGRLVFMIGVSYFSFKMIHFVIESFRRKIEQVSFLNYVIYIMFFLPFISGPINRFNHFSLQVADRVTTRFKDDLIVGSERIINGLFKKFVLAQIIYPYILTNQTQVLSGASVGSALIGLYAYAFYFYFDFAGYSDLAIGSSRLLGIQLPENFNNPFLKKNIRELWTNWHMSLTSWLVDYIYWPLVRKMRGIDYFRKHPIFLSNLGMITTFIVCGIWHGETMNFVLWGAYHGIGISILTIYQRHKNKVRNPSIQKYFRSKVSVVAGTFLTYNYFAIGLALFVLDMKNLVILLKNMFT